MSKFTVEYDNDTGPDDGGFWEWWTITDGNRVFEAKNSDDAVWLCELLNKEIKND